ncbi:short chain dehydrogenase [Durotheca rogersii]|uniref:short chain dehydrogenase n=1 Tax=Durotheca rogersii TaxID=419775 RepID=UPI00221F1803|nr:short chain dehydrogenase [Durotheca rogersii]KAI5859636.1 short chain dehydrogenase [Durotheca rogersii]
MKIAGRTFVVSGGASGLGQACVEEICRQGGHAAVLDVNEENGAAVVQSQPAGAARFFACDVLEADSVTAAVDGVAAWARETRKPLGGVIPAAGVGSPATILDRDGAPFDMDTFNFVVDINLRGTVDLVRQCVAYLAKADLDGNPDGERGVVVMVSSVAAYDGQRGQVAYAASKGAVASMALPMARDLSRYGVRCVAVAPGIFDSRMTAAMPPKLLTGLAAATEFPRRAGQPHEFAQLVRQIIENPMLNGTVIRLDGGLRMPSKI